MSILRILDQHIFILNEYFGANPEETFAAIDSSCILDWVEDFRNFIEDRLLQEDGELYLACREKGLRDKTDIAFYIADVYCTVMCTKFY